MGNSRDPEMSKVGSIPVASDRIINGCLLEKLPDCIGILTGNTHHLQALSRELAVEFIEMRNRFTAGSAPGCPEFEQHRLVFFFRGSLDQFYLQGKKTGLVQEVGVGSGTANQCQEGGGPDRKQGDRSECSHIVQEYIVGGFIS